MELLFVLESPHTDEVKSGLPLAGSSGIIVTEVLKMALGLDDNCTPFGYTIKGSLQDYKIGIMNCSLLPLQGSVYKHTTAEWGKISGMLEVVRKNFKPRIKNSKVGTSEEINSIIRLIKASFTKRIKRARITENTVVILCGGLSSLVWHQTAYKLKIKSLYELPHPSMGQWFDLENIEKVLELKKVAAMSKTRRNTAPLSATPSDDPSVLST